MNGLNFNSLRFWPLAILAAMVSITATAPAAEPAPPNAQAVRLVGQLADNDAAVRQKAAWRLREIGLAALPALRAAADSEDPEQRTAVLAAIKAIGGPLPEEGNGPYDTKVYPTVDEHYSADFSDGKRVVRIEGTTRKEGETSPHNIKITFTGKIDGKESVQTFTAIDEDDLKWNAPLAWEFYHRIYNKESDMRAVRVTNERLHAAVNAAMDKLNFTPAQRKQVDGRLNRYDGFCSRALAAIMHDPDNAPQKMAEQYRESDSLRIFLTEKQLPIVESHWGIGAPREARLGIYFLPIPDSFPPEAQRGLLVRFPATGERGDRIGVRAGDIIQRVDGVEIDQVSQLRDACLAKPEGMTIEVYRNGKIVALHEKPNVAPTTKP